MKKESYSKASSRKTERKNVLVVTEKWLSGQR